MADKLSTLNKLQKIADEYAAAKGLSVAHGKPTTPVKVERAKQIAKAYEEMKHAPDDPQVQKAYRALIDETAEQFKQLKKSGLRYSKITPEMENPYKSSADLMKDLQENNHIWYYPTESGFGPEGKKITHPLLETVDVDGEKLPANDIFRIVHDAFGHGKEGYKFGAKGEEAAWRQHMQMYSPDAQKALTTETRGQNSWVNYGPHGDANRANPSATKYAEQKAGLLPDWAYDQSFAARKTQPSVSSVSPLATLQKGYDVYQKGMEEYVNKPAKEAIGKVADITRIPGALSEEQFKEVKSPVETAGGFAAEMVLDPLNFIPLGKAGAVGAGVISRKEADKILNSAIKIAKQEGKTVPEVVNTLIGADAPYIKGRSDLKNKWININATRDDVIGHALMEKYGISDSDIGKALQTGVEKMAPGFSPHKLYFQDLSGNKLATSNPDAMTIHTMLPLSQQPGLKGALNRAGYTGETRSLGIFPKNMLPDSRTPHQAISTLAHELGHAEGATKYGQAANLLENPYNFDHLKDYTKDIQEAKDFSMRPEYIKKLEQLQLDIGKNPDSMAKTFEKVVGSHHILSPNNPFEYNVLNNALTDEVLFPSLIDPVPSQFSMDDNVQKFLQLKKDNPELYTKASSQLPGTNKYLHNLIQLRENQPEKIAASKDIQFDNLKKLFNK